MPQAILSVFQGSCGWLLFPLDNGQEEIPTPWPLAVTAGLF